MKKVKSVFLVILVCMSLGKVYAGGAISAAIATAIEGTQIEHLFATIANGIQIAQEVIIAYNHLQYGIQTAKAAIQNLKNFDFSKMKTLDDWVDFFNHQMDLERRTEAIFSNIGVRVGGKTYGLMDTLDIPQAIAENEYNQWNSQFTDRERKKMWVHYGLKPANYYYMKTWQQREKDLVGKMAAKPEVVAETQIETAGKVEQIVNNARSTDSANALSQAQIEMQGIQTQETMETNRLLAEQSALMVTEAQLKNQIQMPIGASDSFLKNDPVFDE
ncbi:hypothetical protein FACS189485_21850 [Spirochaetia bacterium]|nr:hypothetical protein FACS189485_21850 [Spirochaetia bacterium]